MPDYEFIYELKKFYEPEQFKKSTIFSPELLDKITKDLKGRKDLLEKRKNGVEFTFEEHLRTIIFSLLSKQRPWKPIEDNIGNIDKIFYSYDIEKIKQTAPEHFIKEIQKIKCGNRSIKRQMEGLKDIIEVLEGIEKEHGSLDNFYYPIIEKGSPCKLIFKMADSRSDFKIKNMGIALLCEYIKNIGIDVSKPDTHMKRIFGKNILGFSKKEESSDKEALDYVEKISKQTHISQAEIDGLIWIYCADNYCEICTKENPKCNICVIKKYCNKHNDTNSNSLPNKYE